MKTGIITTFFHMTEHFTAKPVTCIPMHWELDKLEKKINSLHISTNCNSYLQQIVDVYCYFILNFVYFEL